MKAFYSVLVGICNKMGKYRITRLFYGLLANLGLIRLGHFIFHKWFRLNPTLKMLEEKKFLLDHAQELEKAYDCLSDEHSRVVYENILKFRVTSDWKYLKAARGADGLKNQYFVPELQFSDHEVIVDCGAFNGDTAKKFYAAIPGCIVIGLEPDERNYNQLAGLKLEGMKAYQCGAWSQDTVLSFSDEGGGTAGGAVSDDGMIKVEVKALDHLPECQSATYIKMDIEGAELEALKGAESIIKNNKPKLAICLYHQPQDFFEIPLYIKKLNPDYTIYIHHHNRYCTCETVLYAV